MKNFFKSACTHNDNGLATLLVKGKAFDLRCQSAQQIDDILNLQTLVIDALADSEKTFVVAKQRAFFEKHFAQGNLVLGVYHEGQLVAQSIIVNPTAENSKTGMTDMALPGTPETLTIIQGVMVHPAYRGHKLMTAMVDAWLSIAARQGRVHALAEACSDNHYSWSVFLKEGLKLHSIGYDANDNVHLYNLHAQVQPLIRSRLRPAFATAACKLKREKACAVEDIATQKTLIDSGYKGVAFDKAKLVFQKPLFGRAA